MAGQSVGMVTCIQSTAEIMHELIEQANAFLEEKPFKAA